MLIAIGVAAGHLIYIPIGAAKCFPVQHTINVLSAVMLGPWYGVANAFLISLIRNILGTGSLLAFPGSMLGALLAGILFKKFKNRLYTILGEVFGTGIIGGLISFPIAKLLMGKEVGAFFFVIPFLLSTLAGSIIAAVIISIPRIQALSKTLYSSD
jgi:energy coupling factor transporter S component ThiW